MTDVLGTVQPFRYRGYVYDQETGLYYLRSRYYNSEWLRFVNADMLLQQNFNLFGYCMQNPIARVDPDGAAYFDQATWDMISNRSYTSPLNIGSIAGGYQGNTADISSSYAVWRAAQAYEEAWINSPYNMRTDNSASSKHAANGESFLPISYWENNKAPLSATPNSRIVTYKFNGYTGLWEKSESFYGINGRWVIRIDWTNHGRYDHANPHVHMRIYNDRYPEGLKLTRMD